MIVVSENWLIVEISQTFEPFSFVCRYVLESAHVKKFFDYIQLPNFDIAADAAATFKVRLTQ